MKQIGLIIALSLGLAACGKKGDVPLDDDLIVKTDQPTVVKANEDEKPKRTFILDPLI